MDFLLPGPNFDDCLDLSVNEENKTQNLDFKRDSLDSKNFRTNANQIRNQPRMKTFMGDQDQILQGEEEMDENIDEHAREELKILRTNSSNKLRRSKSKNTMSKTSEKSKNLRMKAGMPMMPKLNLSEAQFLDPSESVMGDSAYYVESIGEELVEAKDKQIN